MLAGGAGNDILNDGNGNDAAKVERMEFGLGDEDRHLPINDAYWEKTA